MIMHKTSRSNFSTLVHRRLSEVLLFQSSDPRFSKVTISRVETTPSLTSAKVYVSIFPTKGKEELIASLNHASGFFSRNLGKVLKTRNTPHLTFEYDRGFDHSDEIEILLRNVLPEDTGQQRESEFDKNE
ncbi:MAG TPA: 30S ribosome-binding factor RbfA [Deltaproteobacteria bacterium]|nr:30S ribosome-binding factor RbfA [Deltaproteobacteria bacterium]